jgi:transketolase
MTQQLKDIRDAFFDELYEIAAEDPSVIFMTADMGAFSLDRFRRDFPERFINVGIAEQNLVSVAAGLALEGKKVFIYAIIPFITLRCLEQIKVDLCVMDLPVTIIGTGSGFTYSNDGPTHHAIEDISILRALPEMSVLNPCDQVEAGAAARIAFENQGPVYVRLDKGMLPMLHDSKADLSPGAFELREGSDLLIVATGIMVHKAFELADMLAKRSIRAGILDIFQIKPQRRRAVLDAVRKYTALMTLEEQVLTGGIGSSIGELLADEGHFVPLLRVGVAEEYCKLYGDREWMHSSNKIDTCSVANRVAAWFQDGFSVSRTDEKCPADPRYTQCLTTTDFAETFGVTEDSLPSECRAAIGGMDFRYHVATGPEREELLLRTIKELDSELKISGPHRKTDWEHGWQENLENFVNSNYDPNELVPKFVKRNAYIRFKGQYISPANPAFETAFVEVLRLYLFETFFPSFSSIYEFGCGTGHNLLTLAKLYPDKKLVGLDWAKSSNEIVKTLARKCNLNIESRHFDLFRPTDLPICRDTAVFTIGTMEQLGTDFEPFLKFLLKRQPGLCINIETIHELYDQESLFDYTSAKYLEKRNYLRGYLTRLKELEKQGRLTIIDVRKTFGSFFHDGYSYIVWKPATETPEGKQYVSE